MPKKYAWVLETPSKARMSTVCTILSTDLKMKYMFTLLVTTLKLVAGEPLVLILPASPSSSNAKSDTSQYDSIKRHRRASHEVVGLDFGRQLNRKDTKHTRFLSDTQGKPHHEFKGPKIKDDTGKTGLLDFDNPLEDVLANTKVRQLGKASKSKSGKSKSGKVWYAKAGGKSAKSRQVRGTSTSEEDYDSSDRENSLSLSTYSSDTRSLDAFSFSYPIGSYGNYFSFSTESPTPAIVTAFPVSVTGDAVPVDPAPQDVTVVSELATNDSSSAVSGTSDSAAFEKSLSSPSMYYIATAALVGGLVSLVAAVCLKRKRNPYTGHTKLIETASQDGTEATEDGSGGDSCNLDSIQSPATSNHHDAWLASNMQA